MASVSSSGIETDADGDWYYEIWDTGVKARQLRNPSAQFLANVQTRLNNYKAAHNGQLPVYP